MLIIVDRSNFIESIQCELSVFVFLLILWLHSSFLSLNIYFSYLQRFRLSPIYSQTVISISIAWFVTQFVYIRTMNKFQLSISSLLSNLQQFRKCIKELKIIFILGGGGRGGGGGGFKGGKTVVIEPHRHEGIFIARGKEDALVTKNLVPGSEVYGEKRISVEVSSLMRNL